jgi:hypothetical protein
MIAPPRFGRTFLILLTAFGLNGCIARTAASVVTAPVRVVSKGMDLATTSQSEADEKRGRALREREERLGELDRRYRGLSRQCARGDENACEMARREYDEIQRLPASADWRR